MRCAGPIFVTMTTRRGTIGNGVGPSSAAFSAGEAAPTPSTQYLLAALSLLSDAQLRIELDERIFEMKDNIGFLETANNQEPG